MRIPQQQFQLSPQQQQYQNFVGGGAYSAPAAPIAFTFQPLNHYSPINNTRGPSPSINPSVLMSTARHGKSPQDQMVEDLLLTDAIFPLTIDTDMVFGNDDAGGNDDDQSERMTDSQYRDLEQRTISPAELIRHQRPPPQQHFQQVTDQRLYNYSSSLPPSSSSRDANKSRKSADNNDVYANMRTINSFQSPPVQVAPITFSGQSMPGSSTSLNSADQTTNESTPVTATEDFFQVTTNPVYELSTSAPPRSADALLHKHAVVLEKRRKRRESHNAVERRRRDNINDRIQELSLIVPDCIDEIVIPGTLSVPTLAAAGKPHKGDVLKKSADYIKLLQTSNLELQAKVNQLEQEAKLYRARPGETSEADKEAIIKQEPSNYKNINENDFLT